MMLVPALIFAVWVPSLSSSLHTENVEINTGHVVQEVDDLFVGFCIDSSQLHFADTIDTFRSTKLLNYVKPLTPSYVRVGGTNGDSTIFDFKATKIYMTNVDHYFQRHLPISIWDELNIFVRKSGLKLIFGLNELERAGKSWDPTNSVALLKYSTQKGYQIAGFELGNEPNLYYRVHHNISEAQLGTDFQELKRILQTTSYKDSLILGPDNAGFRSFGFLKNFLSHSGSAVDIVTFHQYNGNGKSMNVSDFTDPVVFDRLLPGYVAPLMKLANQQHPPRAAWLGETSTAASGGAVGISDRYVAGFLWLDKLGISAHSGVKGVMRQTLYHSTYGLLNMSLDPNPDYWLTVLYKRLVGNKVFDVKTSSHSIRIYAHCTKHNNQYNYAPGSLTVYALNLHTDSIIFQFPHLQGQHHYDVFWLTPENGSSLANRVQLNGKILEYSNGILPPMAPVTVTSGSVMAPGRTFGYIVIPDANIAACKTTGQGSIVG